LSRKWVDAAKRNVHWAYWPKKRIMHRSMEMHNALWKSVKSQIGLKSQPQTIQKLIPGQTEIKQTNDLIKLSHRTRHWFMNSIIRSVEINTQKLGTASWISWCNQIENGQQVWWVHSPTQNIENMPNHAHAHKKTEWSVRCTDWSLAKLYFLQCC
jgi:hypothetical protein